MYVAHDDIAAPDKGKKLQKKRDTLIKTGVCNSGLYTVIITRFLLFAGYKAHIGFD